MIKKLFDRIHLWPWVSVIISLVTFLVFQWERQALQMGLLSYLIQDYAFHWTSFQTQFFSQLPHLFSYTFLHADPTHLYSNFIFFLIFSILVEKVVGKILFIWIYFVGGAVAALVQGYFDPFTSGLIGASGAISSVAGAYFVLAPSQISLKKLILPYGFLLLWYTLEIVQQSAAFLHPTWPIPVTEVAHAAHLGGFAWGAVCSGIWIWRHP